MVRIGKGPYMDFLDVLDILGVERAELLFEFGLKSLLPLDLELFRKPFALTLVQ